MAMVIPIMMQRNRIKLLKGIRELTSRRRKPRIKRYPLHLARTDSETFIDARPSGTTTTEVNAMAFLDVAEIDSIDSTPLVRDDGRLAVS